MELALIIFGLFAIYLYLKRKRQHDQFELQMRTRGLTDDEMRHLAQRAADPNNPMRKDLEFIERLGAQEHMAVKALNSATFDEVMRATNRLSFSPKEHQYILHFLKTEARNGLVVRFHPTMEKEDVAASLNNGVILLHCPQIESDFLFVKVNDGRGLLGGKKSRIMSYISDPMQNAFTAAGSHGHLMMALTGINNVFRGYGLASGMVT